jgi:hypothetical protein
MLNTLNEPVGRFNPYMPIHLFEEEEPEGLSYHNQPEPPEKPKS